MIRSFSVLLFIAFLAIGGFSKNLHASNLWNHAVEKHLLHHDHEQEHHHHGDQETGKHNHQLEISLLIQSANIASRTYDIPRFPSSKDELIFPLFVSQLHSNSFISSLFRPPII